jgi:hypothetical protein
MSALPGPRAPSGRCCSAEFRFRDGIDSVSEYRATWRTAAVLANYLGWQVSATASTRYRNTELHGAEPPSLRITLGPSWPVSATASARYRNTELQDAEPPSLRITLGPSWQVSVSDQCRFRRSQAFTSSSTGQMDALTSSTTSHSCQVNPRVPKGACMTGQ